MLAVDQDLERVSGPWRRLSSCPEAGVRRGEGSRVPEPTQPPPVMVANEPLESGAQGSIGRFDQV